MSLRPCSPVTPGLMSLLSADVEVDAFLIALGCVGLVFMLPM